MNDQGRPVNDKHPTRTNTFAFAHVERSISGHWHMALDARAAAMLLRSNAAASPPAALSAALTIDPLMPCDDFFRHIFSDTDDVRGGKAEICLRLQLLPALLQRSVAFVFVTHAHMLSGGVMRLCVERARAHVKDKVRTRSCLSLMHMSSHPDTLLPLCSVLTLLDTR
jgi:hypothetical protein